VPVFLAAAAAGAGVDAAAVDLAAFGAIAAGGLGCVWGGAAADRLGRHRVVNLAMAASGACCLIAGPAMVDAVGWRWGFAFLALGPAVGIGSIRRLMAVQRVDSSLSGLHTR
jgi:hypothetical protein